MTVARFPLPVFGFALLLSFTASLSAQSVAVQADANIAIADLAQDPPISKRKFKGHNACISPDGTKVAFTHYDRDSNRRIAVGDLTTGKWELVAGIPGNNSYLPIWSPDGSEIWFNHFLETDWALAKVKPTGGGFEVVKDLPLQPMAYGWFPDGRRLLCHNLESLFILDFGKNGRVTSQKIPKSASLEGLSSPSRIVVSPSGKQALLDIMVESDPTKFDTPASAVFLLDPTTGEARRLTPTDMDAAYPTWLADGKSFLFSSFNPKTGKSDVWKMEIGSKPILVLKNASEPTVASGVK